MNVAALERPLDLDRLMADHLRTVWLYLRTHGCEPDVCDDLSQDVFVEVWRRLPTLEDRGPAAMATYLRMMARSRFIDHCRRQDRRKAVRTADLDAIDEAWLAVMPDSVPADVRLDALDECLAALPGRERAAIDLRFGDERSGPEVALALGTSEDGAWSLLKRARARLRECLSGKLEKS